MDIRSVDFYCERISADFWAEPVNALTNIAFILVGLWALRRAYQIQARPIIKFMAFMIILVGIGSFLFHTFATNLTQWGDLIPIFIFTSVYLYHSLRTFIHWPKIRSIVGMILFIASMVGIQLLVPSRILNGSLLYLPPLLMLFYVSLSMRKKISMQWARTYLGGAFVFFLSLIMRTLDSVICEIFPLGTHFLWHTFNGICLGLLIYVALAYDKEAGPKSLEKSI